MDVHVFLSQGWQGFTTDPSGANLPANKGPWQKFKIINMNQGEAPRIGVRTSEALAAIKANGFYVQPSG
jgi:hypothetical protein